MVLFKFISFLHICLSLNGWLYFSARKENTVLGIAMGRADPPKSGRSSVEGSGHGIIMVKHFHHKKLAFFTHDSRVLVQQIKQGVFKNTCFKSIYICVVQSRRSKFQMDWKVRTKSYAIDVACRIIGLFLAALIHILCVLVVGCIQWQMV